MGIVEGLIGALGGVAEAGFNYSAQIQNLDYQKNLQKQIFEREDNAVSRRAADLKNAGLSKTLAAGDAAGAGTAINTTAPQLSLVDKVATGISYAQQIANVRKTEEETQNLLVQQREAESRMLSQDLERQYTNVKLAIEKGNLDMLPLTRRIKESEINRTNAQIRQIDEIIKASELGRSIDTYKYHNILPNEAIQSSIKIGLLRKEGGKLDADIAYRNLERDLLAYNVTSAMWQSRINEMDAMYQGTYGYKPGTSGTLGSLVTGLFDSLGGDKIMNSISSSIKSGLGKLPWLASSSGSGANRRWYEAK